MPANDLDLHAVPEAIAKNVERFLQTLPPTTPTPDLATEPDGALSLDWIASPNCMVSISVTESNRLAYAWLNGAHKGHGVACFDGTKVPETLQDILQSTCHQLQK